MSLVNLLGPVKVVANEDGTITATLALGAGGAPKKWREVAPYLWQDTTSTDRLAVDVVDGKVTRFTMEPYAPIMVFQRLSAWQALAMPLLVASMVVLLLTVLAWPISRSEEHTSELQSLMRISYAVFCLKKKKNTTRRPT